MGLGKTSAAINFINAAGGNSKFLVIVNYLSEVERIIEMCPNMDFKQPEVFSTKKEGIRFLFRRNHNIVSTHALLSELDCDILEHATWGGYTPRKSIFKRRVIMIN